jgi:hypothetical protein
MRSIAAFLIACVSGCASTDHQTFAHPGHLRQAYTSTSCTSPDCPEKCPIGSYYYTNGSADPSQFLEFCIFDGIKLPTMYVKAACGSITPTPTMDVGWIGFTYPIADNAGYSCEDALRTPSDPNRIGFYPAPNDGITGLCFAALWPPHDGVEEFCDYLTTGCDPDYGCYEGVSWRDGS